MNEKWIGEKVNTSGSYYETDCKELRERRGGRVNLMRLYKFESRFGENYYISDEVIVNKIEEFLNNQKGTELIEFLYGLVIEKFGVVEFIVSIGHKIAQQREEGYKAGKRQMQEDVRKVLGL